MASDIENDEDLCWKLLYELKPDIEKDEKPIHSEFIQEKDSKCEKCGFKELVVLEGEHICPCCNIIQSRVIDDGAEWRFYGVVDNRNEDPTRCGMPTNYLIPKSSL